ncbi:MAG TPA: alanine racemase, partial [Bacteroidales bacterium]|nr:alanine racemase [Bacteroidales bacterium]
SDEFKAMKNVRIRGVMGMATFTNNRDQIHREFKTLMTYYNTIKSVYFINNGSFNEISMGMTDDMDIAIEEGSTMVRIGTALFGSRQYKTE